MAFTKVVGPGIHTLAQLRTHNIHSAGIITATKFVGEMESGGGDSTFQNVTVNGNLTVQGDTTTLNTTLRNVELLRVSAASTTPAGIVTQTGTGDILNLYDGSTEVFSVVDGGKVGIGLTDAGGTGCDPDGNQLLIRAATTVGTTKGHIMLTGDSATNGQGPQIVFSESGGGSSYAGAYVGHVRTGTNSTGDLVFGTRATGGDANTVPTERLRILSTGNIRHQRADNSVNLTLSYNASVPTDDAVVATIDFANNTAHTVNSRIMGKTAGTSNVGGDLLVETREDGGSLTEKFRIKGTGKVGIGVTNPDTLLEISSTQSGTGDLLKITSTTNSQSSRPGISFWNNNPNTAQAQISAKGGASYNASKLHFSVANSSRALADRACIDEFGTFIIGPGETRRNTKGSNQHQVLLIEGTGNNSTRMSMIRSSNDDNGPEIQLIKTRGTSVGSVTKPNSQDYIGSLTFIAGDDTDLMARAAEIAVQTPGTPANDTCPGDIIISVTNYGGNSPTERLRIGACGVTTTSATIDFPDGKQAIFGNSSDLQIWHDSNNSRISDRGGAGNLQIETNSAILMQTNDSTNAMAKFFTSGNNQNEFYNDNDWNHPKLRTTDHGIDIFHSGDYGLSFSDNIGEIGSVAGFQAINKAANANTEFGIRANDIRFATGSTEKVRIDTNGRLGIAITNPSAYLHVGAVNTSSTPCLYVRNHTSGGSFNGNYGSEFRHAFGSVNHCMLIHTEEAHNYRRVLDISDSNGIFATFTHGKLGVGTTLPSNKLDVQGGTTNTAIVARSTDSKAQISLLDNSTTSVGSVVIGAEGDALFLTSGSGGDERLRIDSVGRILAGTATYKSNLNSSADAGGQIVQFVGKADNTNHCVGIFAYSGTTNPTVRGAKLQLNRARSTDGTSNTPLANNDLIGTIEFKGNDGTSFTAASKIDCFVEDSSVAADDMGGRLVFSTTAEGGHTPTERLRINSSGTIYSYSPDDATPNIAIRSSDTNWHGYLTQTVEGGTISSILSCGGKWNVDGTTYAATKDYNGSFPTSALVLHNQYNGSVGSHLVFLSKANGSSTTDGDVSERLRIRQDGQSFFNHPMNITAGSDQGEGDATLKVTATTNNDWGIWVNKYSGSANEYGINTDIGKNATLAYQIRGDGSSVYTIDGAGAVTHNMWADAPANFISGGLTKWTQAVAEYHYTWGQTDQEDYYIDLTCGSYFQCEFIYTSDQSNGGHMVEQYARGNWANNHLTHRGMMHEWIGGGGNLVTTFTVSDQSGNGSADMLNGITQPTTGGATHRGYYAGGHEGNGGTNNGRLRIAEDKNNASASVGNRSLIVKVYYGSFSITKTVQ